MNKEDARSGDFDELYPALGRLVVNYSRFEFSLRNLACWLLNVDELGIIFEGQSVDALIDTCKALLAELKPKKEFELHDCERFEAALAAGRRLNPLRNLYVHGGWWPPCPPKEECQCEPRLPGSPADSRIFHVSRSRVRKWHQDKVVAVIDVENLADQVGDLADEIYAATHDGLVLSMAWEATHPPEPFEMHSAEQILFEARMRSLQHKRDASPGEPDHNRSTELGQANR